MIRIQEKTNYVSSRCFAPTLVAATRYDVAAWKAIVRRSIPSSLFEEIHHNTGTLLRVVLLMALALPVAGKKHGLEVNFDVSLRDPLSRLFFATVA